MQYLFLLHIAGVPLNRRKDAALHFDINSGQNIFWFTTTGWMMWQWLIGSALGTQFTCFTGTKVQILTLQAQAGRGAAALLYDGDPFHPTPSHLWQVSVFVLLY